MFRNIFKRVKRVTWTDVREELLNLPQIEAKQTNYREVIQINVPTRFYWTETGFDGIEVGPFARGLFQWEEEMLQQCLESIAPAIGIVDE